MKGIIYKLTLDGDESKVYIGQTCREIHHRIKEHTNSLNKGAHHSKKLQQAWDTSTVKELIYDILEEPNISELAKQEESWVHKYNSYNNGYNSTPGGDNNGHGFKHLAAKYTEDDYKCVLMFLAHTTLTAKQISLETSVSVHVVTDIMCQVNHTNLKDTMPVEYAMMLSQKRQGRSNIRNDWPDLVSPDGIRHKVSNANAFCKTHGLSPGKLSLVMAGKRNHHFGWRLAI